MITAVLVAGLCLAGAAPAQDSLDCREAGSWPFGPSYAVEVDTARNLAFVGSGSGVYVLDVSGASLGHDPNCRTIRSCPALALLDISGRKVIELQPGENDVRHLAPGVYFIRVSGLSACGHAQAGVMPDASSVAKVVIQR